MNGLIAGGGQAEKREDRLVTSRKKYQRLYKFATILSNKHHKPNFDAISEIDLVKAQNMGLKFLSTIQLCCTALWRRVPPKRRSRTVGFDDAVQDQGPPEV